MPFTYEPLSGDVRATADGLRLRGRNTAGTLAVAADCVAQNNWLVVRGEVQNLTDADHAVSLRFALPVACKGWHWGTRLHKKEPLLPGRRVHLGKPTTLGSEHMALRPVAAIADADHTLGLAVPVDFIGLYDFGVDVDGGLFSVVIDFAMTPQCPRFFKRVPFELYVIGEADGWGLRSVLARYYANHNAPLTGWQHTLTQRKRFDPTRPHHLRLRLERDTFRLELDGKLVGEGRHECEFGWANIALGVASGHRGHGDVCWWDNLRIRRTP